jgi:hypothetical protein
MLHSLFPKAHRKFLSLPLLGPIADGFDDWLAANGYTRDSRANSIRMLKQVDADLRRRHVKEVGGLTHLILHDCWRTLIKTYPSIAGTVRTLERYLAATDLIAQGTRNCSRGHDVQHRSSCAGDRRSACIRPSTDQALSSAIVR